MNTLTIMPRTGTKRAITHRTRGQRHGPITRLMSPGDLGEILKPFIFLDLFEADGGQPAFAPHPHSGIATLTVFLDGRMTYADSTGKRGELNPGSVEWMKAGAGVWHVGQASEPGPMLGYQLWIALDTELELSAPESLYLEPGAIEEVDGVRVILGQYQGRSSPIEHAASLTYLHVRLPDEAHWTYRPAPDHDLAFVALNKGKLYTSGQVLEREIAVFAEGAAPIELVAEGAVEMVVGSARKHPHDLVSGYYSVHTSPRTLADGERNIAALARGPAVAALHQRS